MPIDPFIFAQTDGDGYSFNDTLKEIVIDHSTQQLQGGPNAYENLWLSIPGKSHLIKFIFMTKYK